MKGERVRFELLDAIVVCGESIRKKLYPRYS
jgi:hypothetical protein